MAGGIPLLGQQGPSSSNPLEVLNAHLGSITALLARLLMSAEEAPHVPTTAPKDDHTWGVFCLGCTVTRGDYTYPCQRDDQDRNAWPPAVLIEVPSSPESSTG